MEYFQRLGDRLRPQEVPYTQELEETGTADDEKLITPSEKRAATDVPFLIAQGCVTIIFLFFLGYCIANGDIQRVTKGYDNCGNVCGKVNNFALESGSLCRALDMTNKRFLYIKDDYNRICVESCDSDTIALIGDRCLGKEAINPNTAGSFQLIINTLSRDFRVYSTQIMYLCLLAVVFSFVILLILRYMTAAFVWASLIGIIIAGICGTVYTGFLTSEDIQWIRLVIPLAAGTITLLIIVIALRARIPLVIQLFKESGKSVSDIPLLLFQPVLTFVTLAIIWSAWLDFTLWIESSGTPVQVGGRVTFEKNAVIHITRLYNFIVMLWMVRFVYGCQSMLLAGAVSKWFFTRNKNNLGSPIYNSTYNMLRYHLGTISFGSLILLLILLLRILLAIGRVLLRRIMYALCLCLFYQYLEMLVAYIEAFVKILTKNAYIVTAIYGYSFKASGRRVCEIVVENALRILTINSLGTFVLCLAKVLVATATVTVGFYIINDTRDVSNKTLMMALVAFVSFLIAHCFLSVYEMATDAIFVCFCEDSSKNDGMARPYYMSDELKEFAEKCKTIVVLKKGTSTSIQHV